MSKKTRTLAVDDHINETLKEPDRYAFEGESSHEPGTIEALEDNDRANPLFRMTDAALEGRLTYYQREYAFNRSQTAWRSAKSEVSRTEREIGRRKIVKRREAEKAFQGQAANDLEADHALFPAEAA